MNAIVTLILAVSMLAVGLFVVNFVRGKATTIFEQLESEIPTPERATPGNPLTISGPVAAPSGKTTGIKISYYSASSGNFKPDVVCTGELGNRLTVQATSKNFAAGESKEFLILLTADKDTPPDRYLCTVSIEYEDLDFSFTVTS